MRKDEVKSQHHRNTNENDGQRNDDDSVWRRGANALKTTETNDKFTPAFIVFFFCFHVHIRAFRFGLCVDGIFFQK